MAGSWLLLLLLLLAFRVSCCIVATSGWASSEAFLVQGSGVLVSAMAASPPGLGRFRAATCHRWGEEREKSVEKNEKNGSGANAKTHLNGCGENAAPTGS